MGARHVCHRMRPGASDTIIAGASVKYVYIVLIVAFTAMVLLFKFQNLDSVTVSLFSASVTLPLSMLIFGVYVLGMLTGGFIVSLLKSWIRGARGSG